MQTLICGVQNLVPWPRFKFGLTSLGAQSSSHWTTRQVPYSSLLMSFSTWFYFREFYVSLSALHLINRLCVSSHSSRVNISQLVLKEKGGSSECNVKERQCQRMLKLPHNCTHLTHKQSNAQNSPSHDSTVCNHELPDV